MVLEGKRKAPMKDGAVSLESAVIGGTDICWVARLHLAVINLHLHTRTVWAGQTAPADLRKVTCAGPVIVAKMLQSSLKSLWKIFSTVRFTDGSLGRRMRKVRSNAMLQCSHGMHAHDMEWIFT